MSTVHWLSPDEHGEWDDFVSQHPLGLVYHTSSWQRVLESAFEHIRGRFLVLRDVDGRIQAGVPLYSVKSWLLRNRTVSIPFATMCDPLVSTKEEFSLLWRAIERASKEHRSCRIEVRTRHIATDCMPPQVTASARYKHHYLPLAPNADVLLRSFHRTCVRRRIEKAARTGVTIEERQDEESLRMLHACVVATRRRRSLPPMPLAFFQAIYHWLKPDHAALYLAVHAGEAVAGLLALKFKGLWTDEYSGNVDNAPAGANQLLCWEVIQRAKSSGAAFFSFGRTSPDNASLIDYKRRWATIEEDLVDFVSAPKSTSTHGQHSPKAARRTLYTAAKQVVRCAPTAVQKVFGDFCYRHLG